MESVRQEMNKKCATLLTLGRTWPKIDRVAWPRRARSVGEWRTLLHLVLGVSISLGAGAALAMSQYSIERSVVAGGGGTSSAAGYVLNGTIAQSVAGSSAEGAQRAWSGFWRPGTPSSTGDAIFSNGFEVGQPP